MRSVLLVTFLHLVSYSVRAQYYLTGEILDIHGDKLQNVAIQSHSTSLVYQSGPLGEFRILSRTMDDTLTFSVDGYESYSTVIHTTGFLRVMLTANSFSDSVLGNGRRLISMIRGVPAPPKKDTVATAGVMGNSGAAGGPTVGVTAAPVRSGAPYNSRVENPFVALPSTVSFTGMMSRVSYSVVRRFLDMGSVVPPDAVKIEELLNYFNFTYNEPEDKGVFGLSSQLLSCPWNESHRLLFLRVCARKADIERKPPSNLVLLVDASGSMDMPNKLPILKSGIRLLVDNLRDIDTVSLVEFGREVRVVFAGMPGSEKGRIMRWIEGLRPDGPSPGLAGMKLAYEVAQRQFIRGGNNRVILLTDGDIGTDPPSGEQELEDLIGQQSDAGIRLTCGGLGMKNVKDSRLPRLAEIGRGNFAYLDDEEIVEQLLAGELDDNLFCVANNVSVTADFNPALVSEYRLIGYDNKRRALEDTAAGLGGSRAGSGNSLLALFEVAPKADTTGADTLARIKVDYCLPGQTARQTMHYDCMNDYAPFDRGDAEYKQAACIALFGMKLQRSVYAGQIDWMEIEKMARKVFAGTTYLDYDYISLIGKAKKIYEGRR